MIQAALDKLSDGFSDGHGCGNDLTGLEDDEEGIKSGRGEGGREEKGGGVEANNRGRNNANHSMARGEVDMSLLEWLRDEHGVPNDYLPLAEALYANDWCTTLGQCQG